MYPRAQVPTNTEAQQDVQMLHRVRQRLVENRTALMLQVRSLLGEYGMSFPQGATTLRKALPGVLGGEHNHREGGNADSPPAPWRHLPTCRNS